MKPCLLSIILFICSCTFLYQPIELTEVRNESELNVTIPRFKEVELDFRHKVIKEKGFAFLGSALIDIDGDGIDEVFLGGGPGQKDGLFRYESNSKKFINIISGSGIQNTSLAYGTLAIDMDNDSQTDLIVSREDGLYLYKNHNGHFKATKLKLPYPADTVAIGVSACDINLDGKIDLYLSTFISAKKFKAATFNDASHGKPNLLFINKGNNSFEDFTKQSGLEIKQNTFSSLFLDLNGDGFQDMVAALNTGPVMIFKNDGKGHFKLVSKPLDNGFWMGATAGDFDQDGDQDLFFTNIGNTIPPFLLRGDLREDQKLNVRWGLIRNDGNFTFSDITKEQGLYDGEFAWGTVFEDLNLDGKVDLLVSENYMDWPPHSYSLAPHRLFVNNGDKFLSVTQLAGVKNEFYGQPLVSDFNNDGYPDFIWVNIDGKSRAFINKGGPNHYLKILLPDNASSLGATVNVRKKNGELLSKTFITGEGYMSDQTPILFFGLGKSKEKPQVEVRWPDGKKMQYKVTKLDTILRIKKHDK